MPLVDHSEIMERRTLDTPDGGIEIAELKTPDAGAVKPLDRVFSDSGESYPLWLSYGWRAAYFRGELGDEGVRHQLTLGKPIYDVAANGDMQAQMLQAGMPLQLHQQVDTAIDRITGAGDKKHIDTILPVILARVVGEDSAIELVLCPMGTTEDDYRWEDLAAADDHVRIEEMVSEFPADEEALVQGLYRTLSEYSDLALRT